MKKSQPWHQLKTRKRASFRLGLTFSLWLHPPSVVNGVFMQVFWAYIVGMLTSLGKMKLDRIHSMLKMFAVQGTGTKEFSQVGAKGHPKQHYNKPSSAIYLNMLYKNSYYQNAIMYGIML